MQRLLYCISYFLFMVICPYPVDQYSTATYQRWNSLFKCAENLIGDSERLWMCWVLEGLINCLQSTRQAQSIIAKLLKWFVVPFCLFPAGTLHHRVNFLFCQEFEVKWMLQIVKARTRVLSCSLHTRSGDSCLFQFTKAELEFQGLCRTFVIKRPVLVLYKASQ